MKLLHEIAIFQTVKSKVIISLFETVRLSVSISPTNLYHSFNSIKEKYGALSSRFFGMSVIGPFTPLGDKARVELLAHTLMCFSIGTPKIINFPFVPDGKFIVFRCPKI